MTEQPGRHHMLRALRLAERGWGHVHPNPLVGAVVVRDGAVVGEGWHARFGGPHAEAAALASAGEASRGATLYVTLEPCAHHGKTPPCTDAILAAGISRVVYAASDPNPVARGGGDVLRAHGIDVQAGLEEDAARAQNRIFFHSCSSPSPFVALKLALSLDGRISASRDAPTAITGPEATAEVHRMRTGYDAIMVGIGTALADDPLLTVRAAPPGRKAPVRVVVDSQLRLPPTSRLVQTAREAPLLIVTGGNAAEARSTAPGAAVDAAVDAAGARNAAVRALEAAGARVLAIPAPVEYSDDARDPRRILDVLAADGIGSVLCEGGAQLAGSLLRADALQRLALFYAPVMLGDSAVTPFAGYQGRLDPAVWRRGQPSTFGEDVLLTFDRMAG